MPVVKGGGEPLRKSEVVDTIEIAELGSIAERFEALIRLGETLARGRGAAQICPMLLQRLDNPELSRDERRAIIWSLSQARSRKLLTRFRRRLLSKDGIAATDAAFYVGCARDRHSPNLLALTILRHREPPSVRTALWALGSIGGEDAVCTLVMILEQRVFETECIAALGQAGDVEVARRLAPYVVDLVRSNRLHALHALAQIAEREEGLGPALCGVLRPQLESLVAGTDKSEAQLARVLWRAM